MPPTGRGHARVVAELLAALCVLLGMTVPQAGAAPAAQPRTRAAQAPAPNAPWPNRVATFNEKNPALPDPSQVAAEIARYKPQVIGLEETCVDRSKDIREELEDTYGLKYNLVHGSWSIKRCGFAYTGAFGNAILSAAPVSAVTQHKYATQSSETRGYTAVTTQVDGEPMRVYVTHLAEKGQGAARQGMVKELLADAGRQPRAIVLGDFNAQPSSPEIQAMGRGGFHDADPNCGPPANAACKGTADATCPNGQFCQKKFDYIFLKGIAPPGVGVHPNYSDHSLVHADLDLSAPPTTPSGDTRPIPPAPVDTPPVVHAGADARGFEGSAAHLDGSATDDHGPPAVRWSYSPGADVDAGTRCRFGSPQTAGSSFTCTDDGTFTVTLTADDGVNPPVSDSATVRVRNVAPTLHLTSPRSWSVRRTGEPATVRATFTDPGANDTHTCRADWDEKRSGERGDATDGRCSATHSFADPGMYDTGLTVTDDDGASDSGTVMLIAYDPVAGLAAAAGTTTAPDGALSGGSGAGPTDAVLLAKYLTTDSTTPTGSVAVRRRDGGFRFVSTGLDWLVITPDGRTALKGTGTMNGREDYGFLAYASHGAFRLVTWPLAQGGIPPATPAYDSHRGASYDVDSAAPPPLSSGVSVTDTGWVPGVPSLNSSLRETLENYRKRMPKALDVDALLP